MMDAKQTNSKRTRQLVDDKQLSALSLVVLYDTGKKRKTSRLYKVGRVITRRRIHHVGTLFNNS